MGSMTGKLQRLNCELATQLHNTEEHAAVTSEGNNMDLWPQRLGHLCEQQLKHMANKEFVTGLNFLRAIKLSFCEGFVEGKMCHNPFKLLGVWLTRKIAFSNHVNLQLMKWHQWRAPVWQWGPDMALTVGAHLSRPCNGILALCGYMYMS